MSNKASTCWDGGSAGSLRKFHDPNDGTSWAATALAEHYHNSPTSWVFPDYLDLTSQRENDFKDWTSCLSFSKIQQLEATDSPSLFSTCTIMPENELSPLKSPGGCGSDTLTTGQVFLHRAAYWPLVILGAGRGRLQTPLYFLPSCFYFNIFKREL